jgi:prepilin-type N-terminal cleavage/methylation domain-containing protein
MSREGGFTLPEVLVAMVMTAAVLLALYAVFDASVRVFGAARDNAEAAQAARIGLARMEREIRAAYPRDKAGGDATLLTNLGKERLDFGNDLNGNRRTVDPTTGISEPGEGISYTLGAGGAPLRNGRLLVDSAGDIDGRALTFGYCDANGDPVGAGDEADVDLVRVELEASVGTGAGGEPVERVLRTTVALRNR